SSVTNQFRR
ncbi:ABC transporter family protein, partial [Vibrio parahaemolyticus V-223/04]